MKKVLIKTICMILATIFVVIALSACANNVDKVYNDGVIGEKKNSLIDSVGDLIPALRPTSPYYASKSGSVADGFYREEAFSGDGSIGILDYGSNGLQIQAGTLTAGEIKDSKNIDKWFELFNSSEWKEYINKRGLYSNNCILVNVKNSNKSDSIYNQLVELVLSDGTVIYKARTDINGDASLFFDSKYAEQEKFVKVNNDKKSASNGDSVNFVVNTKATGIKELDLMLMIDTTGSMGDELEYLKVELADVVKRVSEHDKALSIRVSVNFYRDEGDDYIVKYFDFRENIEECVNQIKEQSAMGGGDFPEAVHTALENAVTGHQWRNDAMKLCFFVLDAPPHVESEIQGINSKILSSINAASENGIRIIPVASSGIDKDTEYILRSFALMTGGTYIFLTNHSGIGNSHIDPSTDDYTVEPLNECMVRVVCEYCGLEYVPNKVIDVNDVSYLKYGSYYKQNREKDPTSSLYIPFLPNKIIIKEDGQASYYDNKNYYYGKFTYNNGKLTLTLNVDNEENEFVFEYKNTNLVLIESRNKNKNIGLSIGNVFQYTEKYIDFGKDVIVD